MDYVPQTDTIKDPRVVEEFRRLAELLGPVYRLPVLHVAPEFPTDGDVVICDGSDWDPLSDATKQPVWYDGDTASWKGF